MSTNASLRNDQPIDPDVEQLVAYLDGELHGTERDAIEKRLLDEEPLRVRLQELQAGWDWLDQLPDPAPDEKLVESTLELLVSDLEKQSPATKRSSRRLLGPLAVIALSLAAAFAGFGYVKYQKNAEVTQQLADLNIVENLDAYLHGSDANLMRDLMANKSWTAMVNQLEELRGSQLPTSQLVANMPIGERPEKLASLTVDQRATLESNWDRFQRQDPESKAKLRATARAVDAAADKESLLSTMVTYANWRENSLTTTLRDNIADEDPRTRRLGIEEAVKHTLQQVSMGSGRVLDDETASRIFRVLKSAFDTRVADDPKLAAKLESDQSREHATLRYMYRMLDIDKKSKDVPGAWRLPRQTYVAPITETELISLVDEFEGQALEDYKLFSQWSRFLGPDPVYEEITLLSWAEETLIRKWSSLDTTTKTPIQHYLNLEPEQRDRLDLRSPAEFKLWISWEAKRRQHRRGFPPQ